MTCIKSKWYIHPEAIEQVVESAKDRLEDGEVLPPYEEWGRRIAVFSLQEILDLTKGLDPNDITINIVRDRYVSDIAVPIINRSKQ